MCSLRRKYTAHIVCGCALNLSNFPDKLIIEYLIKKTGFGRFLCGVEKEKTQTIVEVCA